MKKLLLIQTLLFSLFVTTVGAQGTAANSSKNALLANQNHPAQSSPAAKLPVAKKEPRRAKTSSPEIEIKPTKK